MASPLNRSAAAQAEDLANCGAIAEAYRLLDRASSSGDAMAAVTLAEWRLTGQRIRRDLAQARELYGRAAALGLDDAEPIYIALLANGAGGNGRDWPGALARLSERAARDPQARRQCDLLANMALTGTGDPIALPEQEAVSTTPFIERRPGFLSADECEYLIALATPLLQEAVVIHPQTGQPIRDPIRTAHSAAFPFVMEDPVLHAINRRIAAATGTTYEQGEPLQVLSYVPGQEYKLHSDALPPGSNQRVATFLVALNADFSGGETEFPHAGLALRGQTGDALHFRNVDNAGRPDLAAWHAGLPVRQGRKFLLSKWLRENPLDLSGPPRRPF
ncbi:MAG TPA: 2OG-Fe(II) oxygenase [Novosphingobium sp.]|nr:2OG-Fe(II) oxygenase [Novosphingobium sp.]